MRLRNTILHLYVTAMPAIIHESTIQSHIYTSIQKPKTKTKTRDLNNKTHVRKSPTFLTSH